MRVISDARRRIKARHGASHRTCVAFALDNAIPSKNFQQPQFRCIPNIKWFTIFIWHKYRLHIFVVKCRWHENKIIDSPSQKGFIKVNPFFLLVQSLVSLFYAFIGVRNMRVVNIFKTITKTKHKEHRKRKLGTC